MGKFDVDTLSSKQPMAQFQAWYDEAQARSSDLFDPSAMTIATASKDGAPSCRMMLLKGLDEHGFKFFGHYGSRWSKDIRENGRASLQFYWEPLKRSVRIDGTVEKLTDAESDQYFHSRDKGAQISAVVSQQSTPITGRQVLDDEYRRLEAKYADTQVPRPAEWGGYRVRPESIEFWQAQENRLHDRLQFRRLAAGETADNKVTFPAAEGWVLERLSP